jgi:hypothetical protein
VRLVEGVADEEGNSPMADLPASQEVLRRLLLGRGSRRTFVPISRAFLQVPRPKGGAGPLAHFVTARRKRALDLYLLIHAVASSPPHDVVLPARVWAQAIGLEPSRSASVQVSTNLSWLESQRLIETSRAGRFRRIVLLSDDGGGLPYRHPAWDPPGERSGYLKLSYDYWLERWHTSLDLAATAVLLIALSLPDRFLLPQTHAAEWYGVSRDTIQRGLQSLRDFGLLTYAPVSKIAPSAPTGITVDRLYSLTGPLKMR